jgi:multiple sugar transport system permease protein
MKKNGEKLAIGLAFIAPNYIGFIIFTLIPMLFAISLSFFDWNMHSGLGNQVFVGFDNFTGFLKDEWFINSFINTVVFAVVSVPAIIFLSLMFAYIVDKYIFAKKLVRSMFFLPYVANIVAICYIWMMLFQPTYGPVNQFIAKVSDSPPGWLTSSNWALVCIILMQIWCNLGYCMVIYLAGLKQIPKDLLEAAQIDGTSTIQQLRYVIVPMLSSTTFFIMVTMLINALKIFAPMNIMTDGGPGSSTSVLVFYAYITAFRYNKMGSASAISTILFIMIFIITYFQWKGQKKWVNY